MGPKQQATNIRAQMQLLKTQAETVESKFEQTMGRSASEMGKPAIFKQNQDILQKYGIGLPITEQGQSQNANPSPQNGQAAAPSGASAQVRGADRKVIGHVVNGAFVPLRQGQ